jgi:endonuclease/exonuclease/phosphatase family metal-dependent hydrolase
MNPRVLILCIFILMLLSNCSSRIVVNHKDPSGPVFTGNFADEQTDFSGTLTVFSYNTHFAKNIDQIIEELKEVPHIDILLLQEVDEVGTERLAEALNNNYVYIPASIHSRTDKNFGNAILAKWPLIEPMKIVLPHPNPLNKQIRTATRTIVAVDNHEILIYSVHNETAWLNYKKRLEQVDFLISTIDSNAGIVIVGGDFNTFTSKSVHDVDERFGTIGLERASGAVGVTTRGHLIEFRLDHIYTRGINIRDAGKLSDTNASDHFPIWVRAEIEP